MKEKREEKWNVDADGYFLRSLYRWNPSLLDEGIKLSFSHLISNPLSFSPFILLFSSLSLSLSRSLTGKNPFVLDSKKLKVELKEMLKNENRFAALSRSTPHVATKLQDALDRHVKVGEREGEGGRERERGGERGRKRDRMRE